jgi:hypothetical protein
VTTGASRPACNHDYRSCPVHASRQPAVLPSFAHAVDCTFGRGHRPLARQVWYSHFWREYDGPLAQMREILAQAGARAGASGERP